MRQKFPRYRDVGILAAITVPAYGTPPELQTFDFTNFTNLVSLSFTQGTNSGFFAAQDAAYQFDNLGGHN